MGTNKKYWKSLEHLNEDPNLVKSAQNEFGEEIPVDVFLSDKKLSDSATPRRDFLKFLGFSVTAASLAACETPVIKAIPYLNKPEEITPGVANFYASTFYDGVDYANVLVKTREGRPIHVLGNKLSGFSNGAVNSRVNSSVLSLYDSARITAPMANGSASSWSTVDKEIKAELEKISAAGGQIRILSNSIISPSTKQVLADFTAKYTNVKQVTFDSVSYAGIKKANEDSFGKSVVPTYNFDKAKVIVSISADFLSGWLNAIEYAGAYAKGRNPENAWMSKHYQFESNLSLTGSNADVRVPVKPSEQGKIAMALYNAIASNTGAASVAKVSLPYEEKIAKVAKDLLANKGNSLVVAGSNDSSIQVLVNAINFLLGNYGNTIDIENSLNTKQSNDVEVADLVKEMNAGKVSALFIYGVNPVYSLSNGSEFAAALGKVKLSVSFADRADETASLVKYITPDHHYLESWNDFNPRKNFHSLSQPAISPLFKTRQAQDSLLKWCGVEGDYYTYLKNNWNKTIFPLQSKELLFESFWNRSLHDGFVDLGLSPNTPLTFSGDVNSSSQKINAVKAGAVELSLYVKAGLGDGTHANNPWLQELPDPISKVTWDNYVTMSPKQMEDENWHFSLLERGDYHANMVSVSINGAQAIKLPVVPQPGQAYGTIGIALGYGRTKSGKAADNVGQNAFPFVTISNGTYNYSNFDVKVEKLDEKYPIAATQTHHTLMGRDEIVKETVLSKFKKDPKSGNPDNTLASHEGKKHVKEFNLWEDHPVENVGHRWGLTIDLNSCIGCGSCVTACQSENNVPVVGKEEVRKSREMHWMRIDRYYSSDEPDNGNLTKMERAGDNPQVVFQPLMCQHCNHAPCETVCPVAATTHSNEGLNQMTYNRCIGTRYCANNCPYKVRRFNWFNYNENQMFAEVNPAMDSLSKMVLNPDVVVRSRGVMEKCSLCVQQIQAGKLVAKKESRKVADGDIQTACASSCPTSAITFGDLNDKEGKEGKGSSIRVNSENPRAYTLLETVGTKPNIYYLTKVRNVEESEA